MPALVVLDDVEGGFVPSGVRVIDAHTHLFPNELFAAIWRWFDANAWQIRYRLTPNEAATFLSERGVEKVVAAAYAHKPGVAETLNAFMTETMARHPHVWGLGTVMPGEPGARQIVRRALGEQGLCGVKNHCHVQGLAPNDRRLDAVYEEAAAAGKPVLIHAGSGPSLSGYNTDPRALCRPELLSEALGRHPDAIVVVPHLGTDDIDTYVRLLDRHPRLVLDTTMVLAGYFGPDPEPRILAAHADRILYGSDFPNIPYAWDRELRRLLGMKLEPAALTAILWRNARALYAPRTDVAD